MKRIIVIFLICAFPSTISAQNTSESIVENFFNVYKNNSSDAIDYLFQDNKWMEDKFEELLNLKSQLFENQKLLGEFCGYEKITEQNAGKDYKKNKLIADNLNTRLNNEYKGISRGVTLREDISYNQDLNNKIILIKIGGIDSTLEEVNNTMEVLAKIISDYIKES